MDTAEPPRGRGWPCYAVCGCLLGLAAAALTETVHVGLGRNFHSIVPGRVYRSSQPSPADLERASREYGVRTVVNLRGSNAAFPWFREEARATHRLGMAQEDLCFSSYRLPAPHEVRHLLEVFDRAAPPLLIHCRRGADRTGLAAAVYVLAQTEAGLAEAHRQLSWRYGHLSMGHTRHLRTFLELYEEWLRSEGRDHSPVEFRRWVADGYCPGGCRAVLEPLDVPAVVSPGLPRALRVRAHNAGVRPWRLKPENNAGVHLGFVVTDPRDHLVTLSRSGLFDAEVPPGASIDLTFVLPALHEPGRYQVWVDMVDEQHCWFYQAGSEPLDVDVEVR